MNLEQYLNQFDKDKRDKPLFFIYDQGLQKISLPNKTTINITSFQDGIYATVERRFEEARDLLNQYIGHPVYEILCDSNKIWVCEIFNGSEIVENHEHGTVLLIKTIKGTDDGKYICLCGHY